MLTSAKISDFFEIWNSKAHDTMEPNKIDEMKKSLCFVPCRDKWVQDVTFIYILDSCKERSASNWLTSFTSLQKDLKAIDWQASRIYRQICKQLAGKLYESTERSASNWLLNFMSLQKDLQEIGWQASRQKYLQAMKWQTSQIYRKICKQLADKLHKSRERSASNWLLSFKSLQKDLQAIGWQASRVY